MTSAQSLILFQRSTVRRHWDEDKELWYFSVIDVVQVLAGTDRPRKYWNDLKIKLKTEGSQLSDFFVRLNSVSKMTLNAVETAS